MSSFMHFVEQQIEKRPFTFAGTLFVISFAAFFGSMIWIISTFPDPEGSCMEALDTVAVISATPANNGNILCKIIDADSVERSVWLDGDGMALK